MMFSDLIYKAAAFMPRKTEYLDTKKTLIYRTYPSVELKDEQDNALVYEGVIEKELEDRYLVEGSKLVGWHDSVRCLIGSTVFLSKKEALTSALASLKTRYEREQGWGVDYLQEGIDRLTKLSDMLEKMSAKEIKNYLAYTYPDKDPSDRIFWQTERWYGGHSECKPFIYECKMRSEESHRYLVDTPCGYPTSNELMKRKLGIEYFETFEEAYTSLFNAIKSGISRNTLSVSIMQKEQASKEHAIYLLEEELKRGE